MVARALSSAAPQCGSDCEIVVVDDGSTDNSADCVSSFMRGCNAVDIRIVTQANAGVGAARNRGINEARGRYVTFLDADDEWMPGHLDALRRLAENYPRCAVFATNYVSMMTDGTVTQNIVSKLPFPGDTGVIDNYFVVAGASGTPLWTSAVMVRRDAILAAGGFPEGIKSGEDLLTWARLAAVNEIAYCTEPSAIYYRGFSNPRPPEATDEVGRQLELLLKENRNTPGLKRYVALWYNMRMSRCLAHRMYGKAFIALCKSLRYNPTPRIAKPFVKFTLHGLRHA